MKIKSILSIIILLSLAIFQIYHRSQNTKDLKPGSLIKITSGYSKSGIYYGKILAIDDFQGNKVYGTKIWKDGEPEYINDKDGRKINVSSLGHLPISVSTLRTWRFTITGSETISQEEMGGYQYWKEAGGNSAF